MTIAFDIDGCIADFTRAYGKALVSVTGRDLLPEGWESLLERNEFPTSWYWERALGYTKEEEKKVWDEKIIKPTTFWKNLPPLPDAKEVAKQINRLSREGTNIYFLTHRFGNKAKKQTEEFLYGIGVNYPTVLLSGKKAPLIDALGINFFIDDKLETIEEIASTVKVKHLYLLDRPYNREGRKGKYKVVDSVSAALKDADLWKEK